MSDPKDPIPVGGTPTVFDLMGGAITLSPAEPLFGALPAPPDGSVANPFVLSPHLIALTDKLAAVFRALPPDRAAVLEREVSGFVDQWLQGRDGGG